MKALLQLRGISKVYPSVVANDRIDLTIQTGEIHAILGENGAGKSTLMKLIYGASQPDKGDIIWQGQPVSIRNPSQARSLGIGMVFQHFSLFESLTVAQNISLAVKGSIKSLSAQVEAAGERFGLPLSADTVVHSLSVGERQRVEIIRCILQKPKLLIMDEPTSVLPPQGVQQLFETLRALRDTGCSILYISHKLEEIRQLCDNATILRAGKVVATTQPASQSNESLAHMMIGRSIDPPTHAPAAPEARARLSIRNLHHEPIDPFGTILKQVTLQVSPGEIVGIAGVSGNGQNELMMLGSFGYMNDGLKTATRYPDIDFIHASGYKTAKNLGNFQTRNYESAYVAGMAAGYVTKSNTIGMVAAYAIPEVVGIINAFALGAQATNPEVTAKVVWLNSWFDPSKAQESARSLIAQQSDVIFSIYQDTPSVVTAAEEEGVYVVNTSSDMKAYAPRHLLASMQISWADYFIEQVQASMDETFEGSAFWGGMADKAVTVESLSDDLSAEQRAAMDATMADISSEKFHPFAGPVVDQDSVEKVAAGETLSDGDLAGISWLVKGVDTKLPK